MAMQMTIKAEEQKLAAQFERIDDVAFIIKKR